MSGVVLNSANLSDGKFIGATLTGAQLQSATGHESDFSAATLSEAVLTAADLTGAVFDNSILVDADFTAANLAETSFRDARLAGANLETALGVETASFEGACATEDTRMPAGFALPICAE